MVIKNVLTPKGSIEQLFSECNFCKSAKILPEERAQAYAGIDISITGHE